MHVGCIGSLPSSTPSLPLPFQIFPLFSLLFTALFSLPFRLSPFLFPSFLFSSFLLSPVSPFQAQQLTLISIGAATSILAGLASQMHGRPGLSFFPSFPSSFIRLLVYSDRKSTRLNSSHVKISYAVFC